MRHTLNPLASNPAAQAALFRRFVTGVSFTVEETMRKTERDGGQVVAFSELGVSDTGFSTMEAADLGFLDFYFSKHHKVIIDGLQHFERDIQKNLLPATDLKLSGDWRAIRITSQEKGQPFWFTPPLMADSTHTISLPIGPDPALLFPLGHSQRPIVGTIHSALLTENKTTRLLFATEGNSTILIRGAS